MKFLHCTLVLLLLFGCSSSSSVDNDLNPNTITFLENGAEIESLTFAYGLAAKFDILVTDSKGSPAAGLDVEVIDENGYLSLPYFVTTGADGSASVDVGVLNPVITGDTGSITFVVYGEDQSQGGKLRASLDYAVEPWDRILWGGSIDFSTSTISGATREKIYRAPDGVVLVPSLQETITQGVTLTVSPKKITLEYNGDAVTPASAGSYSYDIGIVGTTNTAPLVINITVGEGTEAAPYPLASYSEFMAMADSAYNTAYFRLDGDVAPGELAERSTAWAPGDFSGHLDGNGCTVTLTEKPLFNNLNGAVVENLIITGKVVNNSTGTGALNSPHLYGMLSTYILNSEIKNITVTDAIMTVDCGIGDTSYNRAGLIAGKIRGGSLENIDVTGELEISQCYDMYAGLVAGELGYNISNLAGHTNAAFVSASGEIRMNYVPGSYMGGIAGLLSGTLTDSYSGAVITEKRTLTGLDIGTTGGLIGHMENYSTIERCFSTTNVFAYASVGGLVGTIGFGETIKDSYATGSISGSYAGGVFGASKYSLFQGNPEWASQYINNYSTGSIIIQRHNSAAFKDPSAGGLSDFLAEYDTATGNLSLAESIKFITTPSTAARINSSIDTKANLTVAKNYAYKEMLIDNAARYSTDDAGADGADISATGLTRDFYVNTLGWDADIWDFDFDSRSYKLPILKTHHVDLQKSFATPKHLAQ